MHSFKESEAMVKHKLATLCYLTFDDEVLLLYRNKKQNDFHHGKFIGIGGRLEPGETPLECIQREVKEETGYSLKPKEINFRGYIYFDDISRDVNSEDLPAFNWLVFMYNARVSKKNIFMNPEGELKWFKFTDIPYHQMWDGDAIFTPKILQTNEIFEAKFLYKNDKVLRYTFGRINK